VAKLSARGATVLARYQGRGITYALRSDGVILSKLGPDFGWTTWRKLKPTDDLVAAADRVAAKSDWVKV
jgi:hypothetical protein